MCSVAGKFNPGPLWGVAKGRVATLAFRRQLSVMGAGTSTLESAQFIRAVEENGVRFLVREKLIEGALEVLLITSEGQPEP